jgi:hypothetical protein
LEAIEQVEGVVLYDVDDDNTPERDLMVQKIKLSCVLILQYERDLGPLLDPGHTNKT